MSRRRAVSLGASAAMAAAAGVTLAGPGSAFAQATPNAAGADGSSLAKGLLPDNRLLLYYGFPGNERMGILGEYEPAELLEHLKAELVNYQAADNSRPWKLGLELIASVAQGSPGADNKYIADTDKKWLDLYTEFTAQNDMVLFLDVQMGFKKPKEDYAGLEPWLANDHVHLGIDPEFHMREGELPGQDIGQIDASDVTEAQNWLVDLSKKYNISRKTLIVHQFHYTMIENKDKIGIVNGVDLVIDEDGFGPPAMKKDTYNVVITQEPIEYNGIKLFYKQDDPMMTAAEVLALDPSPDVVIYQ
ncbi:MAG: hypothetical protein QM753_02475 [Thermomicrobiales bacterium]